MTCVEHRRRRLRGRTAGMSSDARLSWILLVLGATGCGPTTSDDDGAGESTSTSDEPGTESGDTSTGNDEPPPGDAGGLCVLIDGSPACTGEGVVCNVDSNYCFLPDAPCEGFACGGEERGTCSPQDGLPSCTCMPGYDNTQFELYCCPPDGSDPYCQ